jgi:hypothetical protein
MQFDRTEASASAQINYHELSVTRRQRQGKDEPVRRNRHRLDACAVGNVDRPAGEGVRRGRGRPAARRFADDGCYEDCETDDEHDAHHHDQDLEPTHAFETRPDKRQMVVIPGAVDPRSTAQGVPE